MEADSILKLLSPLWYLFFFLSTDPVNLPPQSLFNFGSCLLAVPLSCPGTLHTQFPQLLSSVCLKWMVEEEIPGRKINTKARERTFTKAGTYAYSWAQQFQYQVFT